MICVRESPPESSSQGGSLSFEALEDEALTPRSIGPPKVSLHSEVAGPPVCRTAIRAVDTMCSDPGAISTEEYPVLEARAGPTSPARLWLVAGEEDPGSAGDSLQPRHQAAAATGVVVWLLQVAESRRGRRGSRATARRGLRVSARSTGSVDPFTIGFIRETPCFSVALPEVVRSSASVCPGAIGRRGRNHVLLLHQVLPRRGKPLVERKTGSARWRPALGLQVRIAAVPFCKARCLFTLRAFDWSHESMPKPSGSRAH